MGPFVFEGLEKETDGNYTVIMVLAWPSRALWNIFFLSIFASLKMVPAVIKTLTCPTSLLPKRPPKELPPAKPDPDQFNIDEYHRLLEQKAKTDARLKELEAHPDKKKILVLPRRF